MSTQLTWFKVGIAFSLFGFQAYAQVRLWEMRIDDPVRANNRAPSIAVDSQGNTYTAGSNTRCWVAWKTDPTGNVLWTWNDGLDYSYLDLSLKIGLCDDGHVVIAGSAANLFTFVHLDLDGHLIRHHSDSSVYISGDQPFMQITPAGELLLVGSTHDQRALIRKYDPAGNLAWEHVYPPVTGQARHAGAAVWVASNGDVYAGINGQHASSRNHFVVLRYDAAGNPIYETSIFLGDEFNDAIRALAADDAGRCYVSGVRSSSGGGRQLHTLMINPDGEVGWHDLFDVGGTSLNVHGVVTDNARSCAYVAGDIDSPDSGAAQILLLRFTPAGQTWNIASGDTSGYAYLVHFAVGEDGDVHVIANIPRPGVGRPLVAQRYDSSGMLLDEWVYTSGANFGDLASTATRLDSEDTEVVFQRSYEPELMRFDPHGEPQWSANLGSEVGRDEVLRGAASDGTGGLYVLSEGVWNYPFLQRIAADGSVYWRLDLRTSGARTPRDLTVDSAGNAVVSTLAVGGDAYYDPAVMRFSREGALLSSTYCVPFQGGTDYVSAPVLDGNDNAYVAVTSDEDHWGYDTIYHQRLFKIDPHGAIVWSILEPGRGLSVNSAGLMTVVDTYVPPRIPPAPRPPTQFSIHRYDVNGTLQWERLWALDGRSVGGGGAVTDEDGSAYAIASVAPMQSQSSYALVLRYSPNGDVLWTQRVAEFPAGNVTARQILRLADGDVLVAAAFTPVNYSSPRDAILARLSPDGALRWEERFRGRVGDETPQALLALEDGSIVMAGGYAGYAYAYPYAIRVDAGGTAHWRTTKLEPPSGNAYSVTLPANDGGFFLVGSGYSVISNEDVLVARFGPPPPSCVPGARCFGDVDGDCLVGLSDLVVVLSHFGADPAGDESPRNGDLTLDGVVDLEDLSEILSSFGSQCP
jgi:hypothetical protein